MTEKRKHLTIAAIAAVALVVAACGGGGSSLEPSDTDMSDMDMDAATPSTEQERFDARYARNEARDAKEDALTAVAAAVVDAATAMGNAANYASHASGAADRAMAARTDYDNASMASTTAGTHSTAASTAKGNADAAMTALNDAITAFHAAHDDQDIDTQDGANAIETAAMTLEAAANKAMADANTAKTAAETASSMAMDYAMKANMYAGTHVVGLLRMANADHITTAADPDANTDETEADLIAKNKADHVAAVNTAVKVAADDIADPSHGGAEVTATYPYTDLGDDNAVGGTGVNADGEEGDGLPAISVTPEGGTAAALVHADADADPAVTANFVLGAGLGEFPHEKYITGRDGADDTGTRVILFTDKEQEKTTSTETTRSANNAAVGTTNAGQISDPGPLQTGENLHDFTGKYDDDSDAGTEPLEGTFDCVDPTVCTLTRVAGDITAIEGYTFSGSKTTVTVTGAGEDMTWLAFGVWLTETVVEGDDGDGVNTYAFGAFADGGDVVENDDNIEVVTGTATYEGSAAGVHSTTGGVDFFSADATLNADFGDNAANGMITGEIDNIVSGGVDVDDSIYLFLSDQDAALMPSNIDADGSFDGRTRMGTGTLGDDGEYDYPMNGTWAGNFYNAVANDPDTTAAENEMAPGSAAGTFSVSRGDDAMTMMADETESYVGAFGAHCTGSNCGTH